MRFCLFLIILFSTLSLFAQKNSFKLSVFEEGKDKFGVKSSNKIIIKPEYSKIRIEENGLIAVRTQGKWGYFNQKGKEIIGPKFSETLPFKNNYAVVKQENGWGVIDQEGKFFLKPIYKKIENNDEKTVSTFYFTQPVIYTYKKDSLSSYLADSVIPLNKDVFGYFINGKIGLIEKSGKELTQPIYDSIGLFKYQKAIFKMNNKWGVINAEGREIIEGKYDYAIIDPSTFIRTVEYSETLNLSWSIFNEEGLLLTQTPHTFIDETFPPYAFIFKQKDGYGLMNVKSQIILKPEYNQIVKVKNGFLVKSKEGQGLTNFEGGWVYPPRADSVSPLPRNYLLYCSNKVYYLLDSLGRERYCSKSKITALEDGLLKISIKNKVGRIDFSGKEILPPIYDSISNLTADSAVFVKEGKLIGMYNLQRDTLIQPSDRIQEIYPISEGFFGAKMNGKYGFIDGLARIRIANRYEGIGNFIEGYARIKLLGKWGFVDKAEVLRVQPSFESVEDFKGGIAVVKKDGKYGIVNKKGEMTAQNQYDKFERINDGYLISYKRNPKNLNEMLKGLISPQGYEIIYAKYDHIDLLSDGNVIIKKNGKYGVVTSKDLIIHSFIYDKIKPNPYSGNYIMMQEKAPAIVKLPEQSK